MLCWLVQDDVTVDDDELNAARRRAMFVLAAGGDPHRDVGPDSIAAERLADELDTPRRRAQLAAALDELPTDDLPAVTAAVESLLRRSRSSPGARTRSRCWPTSSRTSSRLATRDYSGRQLRGDLETGTAPSAEAPPQPPGRTATRSRTRAPTRRTSAAPASTSGSAGWRSSSSPRSRAPAPARLVDPGAAREAVREARRTRRPSATVDLPGPRGAIVDDSGRLLAGTRGHVVIDADAASLGSRNAHGIWIPSPAGVRALAPPRAAAGHGAGAFSRRGSSSAVLHSPFAPAVVIPHPTAALAAYLQERRGKFPGFKVEGEASRSYPQGAFGSEFLGLLGQISEQELKSHAYKDAKAGEVVGQSGVEAAYDSLLNPGFVQAKIPVDSLGRIAGALACRPRSSRRPCSSRSTRRLQRAAQKALLYGMEQSRLNGYSPTGASAVAIDPWTGAIKAIVSYPTFNQKARGREPGLPRATVQGDARPPRPLNRAIAGRLSDRLDLQADHRRGRAQRGDHHAEHAAALLRLVHLGNTSSITSRPGSTRT